LVRSRREKEGRREDDGMVGRQEEEGEGGKDGGRGRRRGKEGREERKGGGGARRRKGWTRRVWERLGAGEEGGGTESTGSMEAAREQGCKARSLGGRGWEQTNKERQRG